MDNTHTVRGGKPLRGDRVFYVTARSRYEKGLGGRQTDHQRNFDFFYDHDCITMGELAEILEAHPGATVKNVSPIFKTGDCAFITVTFRDEIRSTETQTI